MDDEIKGKDFVMRPVPAPKQLSGKDYARAWLTGQTPPQGEGTFFPSKADVIDVLREEPNLVQQFIRKNVNVRSSYDTFYLEEVANGYDVYYTSHGQKKFLVHFVDLWEALGKYLEYLGLR
jgi:hypothetical protein